jgi:quinol monooxygenase YgiN
VEHSGKSFERSRTIAIMNTSANEIVSTARFTVRPENRRELCLTITSLVELIRAEAGCRSYEFYSEHGEPNSFLLLGKWVTRESWDEHLVSDHFAVLLGSLRLLSTQPDVEFKLLSHSSVIEAITKARCGPLTDPQFSIFVT